MRFHWLSALATTTVIFTVVASVCAEDRKPQAWAVLIGVNDYADLEDLKYASQDVQALSKALTSAGFPESHVFLLHDEAKDVKFRPLKANIERQLGLLAQLAAKDDLLVIAFSGHGMHLEGKTYLCPAEAQVENPQGTMVALDGVYSQLEKCPAALRLMLVDACRNDPRPKGKKSATPKDDLSSLGKAFERPPDGIVVLASCAPGQISYEEQDFGHGVFMHQVLKGLGGSADSNKNGKVSLGELYEFAAVETKAFVARARSDFQSPQLFGRIDGVFEFEQCGPPLSGTVSSSTNMPPSFSSAPYLDQDINSLFRQYNLQMTASSYSEAERTARRMLQISNTQGWQAASLNSLGRALNSQERFEEATPHYERALEIPLDGSDANRGWIPCNLANNLRKRKKYGEAEAMYVRSIRVSYG